MSGHFLDIATEEYHQRDEISVSRLKVYAESPKLYKARFIDRLPIAQQDETEELRFGTLFHQLVLETPIDDWGDTSNWKRVAVVPAEVLNADGHRRGKPYLDWKRAQGDKAILSADDVLRVHHMLASFRESPAYDLLALGGEPETPMVWDHTEGIRCRGCMDFLTSSPETGKPLILDLKTSRIGDPEAICVDIERRKYHWQAAYYRWGYREITGDDADFVFVFCEKTPPFRVWVGRLADEWLERGHREAVAHLDSLGLKMRTGDWSEVGEFEVNTFFPPKWAGHSSTEKLWQTLLETEIAV